MNIEIIQTIISDFHQAQLPELTPRDKSVTLIDNMSIAVVGARRSGKTYRTYQFIEELMEQGVKKENFCRIQFNDYRLRNLSVEDLYLIGQAFYSIYPEKHEDTNEKVYFIFDEIHRIEGWEDYILHLLDNRKNIVLLTGSTSKLQRGEIATGLRGKNFCYELLPFSFKEFLKHYNIKSDINSSKGKSMLIRMLQQYLDQGGFPGLLNLNKQLHIELLQNYWDTMILRDIIEAHPQDNINITAFTQFCQALLSKISSPMTVNKITNNLKDSGAKFSAETLYKYLRYLQEAFMFFTVEYYSKSEKIRNHNYKKVYAVDWVLADAITPGEGLTVSRKLENMVYIELRRRKYTISYYKTRQNFEIDFIVIKKNEKASLPELYQVCYNMDKDDVKDREVRAIVNTAKFLKTSKNVIITFNEKETLKIDGITIHVIPAWEWLLEGKKD